MSKVPKVCSLINSADDRQAIPFDVRYEKLWCWDQNRRAAASLKSDALSG